METDISETDHKRYTLAVGFVAFMLLALTASVNIAIDPYRRFGARPILGLSVLKPAAIGQVRMAKAYGVIRRDFKTLLLGNSRVDVGIDPRSPGFSQDQAPVYNLGQPGTGSETALAYLKHAADNHRPVLVVMGVDFLSYLQPRNRAASNTKNIDYTADFVRLNLHNPALPWWRRRLQPVNDALTAALSLSFQVKKPNPTMARVATPNTLVATVPSLESLMAATTSRSAATEPTSRWTRPCGPSATVRRKLTW